MGYYFLYFSTKIHVVSTDQKRINEALLTSTTTYVFVEKQENIKLDEYIY